MIRWPLVRRSRLEEAERDLDCVEEEFGDLFRVALSRIATLRSEIDALESENDRLRSQIYPRCPKTGKMLPKGER